MWLARDIHDHFNTYLLKQQTLPGWTETPLILVNLTELGQVILLRSPAISELQTMKLTCILRVDVWTHRIPYFKGAFHFD